jgi:hypothetical protein
MTTEPKPADIDPTGFNAACRPDPEVETTEATLLGGVVRSTRTGVQRMNPLASAAEPQD